jgi:polyhydroxybutyrate depolymerase
VRWRARSHLLVLAALLAACGSSPRPAAAPVARASPADCGQRLPLETVLRVPDGPARPRPLILALHGATQSGIGLQAYSALTPAAHGEVVAYPSTPHDDGFWRVADVPRLLRLLDAIGRCTPVRRVTAVGFSNGGLMANALACHAAERIDGLVLIAAGYRNLGPCHPARPVPVLAFHGSRDVVVPYRGFDRFMASWAHRDGCAAAPVRTRHRFTTRFRWRGCSVELVRVEGDTHGWPALDGANREIARFAGG